MTLLADWWMGDQYKYCKYITKQVGCRSIVTETIGYNVITLK